MSLQLGTTSPDFEADTSEGPIRFHAWAADDWVIFFSHPADFTPVCTTELGLAAKLKDKLAQRGAKALAISVDPVDSHKRWIKDIEGTQKVRMNFPIVADPDRKVAKLYNMIHPEADAKLTDEYQVATPANWKDGDDVVIVPSITDPAEIARKFPKGHKELRPYLRMTPQPNK